ncbi:MAG: GNAT family N-acetyltransferase [Acidobacteriia bacterium]|nr:GNAT family N-acetyltransferase [Terriglobia bacterium]
MLGTRHLISSRKSRPHMLTIEPIDLKHSTAIHRIISDPQLTRTSDIPSSPSPDDTRAWIGRMKRLEELGTGQIFVILINDLVVGVCGLYGIDKASGSAELGFFVGSDYWRHGYASAGSSLLLMDGFVEMGLKSVRASCLTWNDGAKRVLQKLGFQALHEGPPPPNSKFPQTEKYLYWSLDKTRYLGRKD